MRSETYGVQFSIIIIIQVDDDVFCDGCSVVPIVRLVSLFNEEIAYGAVGLARLGCGVYTFAHVVESLPVTRCKVRVTLGATFAFCKLKKIKT